MIMGSYREFLKDQGIKKWDIIAVDYAARARLRRQVQGLVASQGGTIGKTLFTPFGTPDFGAKISELGAEPADGLFRDHLRQRRHQPCQAATAVRPVQEVQDGAGQFLRDPANAAGQGDTVLGVYQNIGFVAGSRARKPKPS
jgi:branched-chain amino acid transport system substrate-binding protein